jgi:UDP-N-acetylglucosamine 2-epimerase (non-hydrolysing)
MRTRVPSPRTGPVVHVVGARPNFVKAAPVVRALAGGSGDGHGGHAQVIVHTGQHYDERMSDVFFRQLGLPRPDVDLGVGSGTHASQTAALLTALEAELVPLDPRLVVVYGDVNSTLAAALVAAKLGMPVAHVEAGLRSFDPTMPEEINRRVTDSLSDLHFVTSPEAIGHLAREGVAADGIHFVGNPMIDTLLTHLDRFDPGAARASVGLGATQPYGLVTLHRPANVDDPDAIAALVVALKEIAADLTLVFPIHPRGRAAFEQAGITAIEGLSVVDPLGYIEFMSLMRDASLVITDSGGVQEETTVLRVPCVTVRPNTERPVTISHGTNRLCRIDELVSVALVAVAERGALPDRIPPLWDGRSGPRIARVLFEWLAR